jgi:Mrp family chromosome partitioning ATPase
MSALLDAALDYARRGWRVFPVVPGGKIPLGALAPEGCHSATTSEVVIRAWWADAPDANIGVATGEKSGLLVLDVDSDAGGDLSLERLMAEHGHIPRTVLAITGGGGKHHYFAYPTKGRLGNSAGRLGAGLDTRGDGGYVVAPPSLTTGPYEWFVPPGQGYPVEHMPVWLLDLLTDKPAPRPALSPAPQAGSKYAEKALADELAAVVAAAEGSRNATLNSAAFSLGQLVGGGLLDAGDVEYALVNAGLVAGLTESETRATVKSGMTAGQREPRTAPERPVEQTFGKSPAAPNRAESSRETGAPPDDDPFAGLGVSGAATGNVDDLDAPTSLADALGGYFDGLEQARQGGSTTVPTGFHDLDALTGGLKPGDLIVVAARPSVGKSAFAFTLARHAADAGVGVLIFSAEMAAQQIAERLVSAEARVDAQRLRTGDVDEDEWRRVGAAFDVLAALPIWLRDDASPALDDLVRRATRAVAVERVGLVVVDYIGLVRVPGARERRLEVGAVSRTLKALARDAGVPVVALSQLNRGVEARQDHRPMLSDLRESGDIEQDADLVMLLNREEAFDPNTDRRNILDVIVGKARNGPTGTVALRWHAQHVMLTDLDVYRTDRADTGDSF